MIFEVKSQKEAEWYASAKHDEKSIIISFYGTEARHPILPTQNENIGNGVVDVLYIQADDADEVGGQIHYYFSSVENGMMSVQEFEKLGRHVFSNEDGEKVCKFVTEYKDEVDRIIVHCRAGVSRSSGCCAAIMKSILGSDWAIFGNRKYIPNMTVYKKTLEAFFSNGYTGMLERRL